jgi:hypothetical protein
MFKKLAMLSILFLGTFLFWACKKESETAPGSQAYQSAAKLPLSPLINANEIDCELKLGTIFTLDGKKSRDSGQLEILRADDAPKDPDHPRPDAGSLRFGFTDLKSRRPRLKGIPYQKAEFEDLIVLSNDVGGAVVSFLIQKSTGGVIRTIGFIGEERPIGDVYVGSCRMIR